MVRAFGAGPHQPGVLVDLDDPQALEDGEQVTVVEQVGASPEGAVVVFAGEIGESLVEGHGPGVQDHAHGVDELSLCRVGRID